QQYTSVKAKPDDPFVIYHTGLLTSVRNPLQFWKAVEALCAENEAFRRRLKIELIGEVDAGIAAYLKQHPLLSEKVNIQGWMAHEALIQAYAKASVLLLVVNLSGYSRANIVGKLFEYLATGKPILGIGSTESDVYDILQATGHGLLFNHDDLEGIKGGLLRLFDESFKVKADSDVQQYSRQALTKRLVEVLEDI
ncbi:MAG: glycosyltransferase, partial [Bacteroidota bacterium]